MHHVPLMTWSREIDVSPTCMDMTLYPADAGVAVCAIPLDIPVHAAGLVAAGRVSADVVGRMREASLAGHELQRRRPELGLAGFRPELLAGAVERLAA